MNTVPSDPIQQFIINHSILWQIQVFLYEGNTIRHHSSYLAWKTWILKSCCKVKSLAQYDWSKTYCLIHDIVLTFIARCKTSELKMTVFQHASVVPMHKWNSWTWTAGAYLKGGGGAGIPVTPPLWKIVFCPYNAGGENARIRRISPLPLTERHCGGWAVKLK